VFLAKSAEDIETKSVYIFLWCKGVRKRLILKGRKMHNNAHERKRVRKFIEWKWLTQEINSELKGW